MGIARIIWIVIAFCLLTILSQIGGAVYLLSFYTHRLIIKRLTNKYLQQVVKFAAFLALYCLATFIIVPLIVRPFGRVPLPITETNKLKPLNVLTCFLNRNYVRPGLKQTAFEVAKQMNDKFPGTVVNYLDASFPFINKFPLIPHLSHNDGKKLDLAFCYIDNKTGKETNTAPSAIGYGVSEEPRPGEVNTAAFCSRNGYWQYSLLTKIVPQGNKVNFSFDSIRTKELVNIFASKPLIEKIFIEPHLKDRLNLTAAKIRFHGCRAVRHDDHIHVQIK